MTRSYGPLCVYVLIQDHFVHAYSVYVNTCRVKCNVIDSNAFLYFTGGGGGIVQGVMAGGGGGIVRGVTRGQKCASSLRMDLDI